MNSVWVLVCDAAKARVFDVREGGASWRLVSETRRSAPLRLFIEAARELALRAVK